MQPTLNEIRGSALWHLHDYSREDDRFILRRIEEPEYRQASFLDQRIEGVCKEAYAYSFRHFGEVFPADQDNPQAHFIFHLGHCGSTLLSRALAASDAILPIREPLTLRALARETTADQETLTTVLASLNRRFTPQQHAVVKATSTCNRLIPSVLKAQPGSRAVLMTVKLESYLAGMLGKQVEPRDLLGHLPARLEDWYTIHGSIELDPRRLEQESARLAVLAWFSSQALMLAAANDFSERCLLLDFEEFLADPPAMLTRVAQHLGFEQHLDALLQGWPEISTGYSKQPDHPYTAEHRNQTLQNGRLHKASEIQAGLSWAQTLLQQVPALEPCRQWLGAET